MFRYVALNIARCRRRLANESTMKEFHQKIRDVQKENDDLQSKLAKKERECEVKLEEKVSHFTTTNHNLLLVLI